LETLHALPLLLPPSTEQARIVEKLEELLSDLDAGVADLKSAQKKLAKYRQSVLKAAVEGALTAEWRAKNKPTETGEQMLQRTLVQRRACWEAKQLAKFKEQGKTPPKDWQNKYPEPVQPDTTDLPELPEGWVWASVDQLSPDDVANGHSVRSADVGARVLRLTAVRNGAIDLNATKFGAWTEDEAKPFAVVEGDLLIVRGNGSLSLVGRSGLVPAVRRIFLRPADGIPLHVIGFIEAIEDGARAAPAYTATLRALGLGKERPMAPRILVWCWSGRGRWA
jgi:type I restriction enzyme S subunit